MTIRLTITAKGQVTLRKAVLEHLGVKPDEKVNVLLLPSGGVALASAAAAHDIRALRGALRRPRPRSVSLKEMRKAIESHDR